jgi:hypothetical protein
LGAKEVFPTAKIFVEEAGKGGRPFVMRGDKQSPRITQDAVRVARIVLAGISGWRRLHAFRLVGARRDPKIEFARRMGDAHPRAIDLVMSGRVNVRTQVKHRESLNAVSELVRR